MIIYVGVAYFWLILGVVAVYKLGNCQILDNYLRLRSKGFNRKAAWFCAWNTKC